MKNFVQRAFHDWAGSQELDEQVYKAIKEEFHVILYFSGVFLDLRPQHRVLSLTAHSLALVIVLLYSWTMCVTFTLQMDDFTSTALTAGIMLVTIFGAVMVLMTNMNRRHLIKFFQCLSIGFYDYEDDEEIVETVHETSKSRKQRLFIMTALTCYLSLTALTAVLGRSMDMYAGVASNSSYVNDVYMLTPMPIWYPFKVTNVFWHYVAMLSQVAVVSVVAGIYIGMMCLGVVSFQCIVLQLKILTVRIKKINSLAYKLYRRRGGKKRERIELLADVPFVKCYRECLGKCAAHHAAIIRAFNHFQKSLRMLAYFCMLVVAVFVAMALFLLFLGGKPSVLSLGLMLLVVEVIDCTILCWQAEQVQQQAGSLQEVLYDTDWILSDRESNKTMMIMVERCKQPLSFKSAVSNTPVNWETFATVMNTAYSYVNLLIAMQN